jgi:GT2 family glycosyltransferase
VTGLAVIVAVSGRHSHLRRQQASLAAGTRLPDEVVIAAMGDPDLAEIVASGPLGDRSVVVEVPVPAMGLPLARARNAGASAALARDASHLVFLDVDCLAAPGLLATYAEATLSVRGSKLLCGPVAYLPPLPRDAPTYTEVDLARVDPHPARPAPPPGTIIEATDPRLFWSLSFATDPATWDRIGGFDEDYVGYGAEDTDFGQRAMSAGVRMWWVGGARAYHQWHPVSDPPVEHLHDIVRNANHFHARWGWFPMEGWLAEFERRGLARMTPRGWVA